MAGWNNYERPLLSNLNIATSETETILNSDIRRAQKVSGQGKPTGKHAEPDTVQAFTQIFHECVTKLKADSGDAEGGTNASHGKPEEPRRSVLDEKKFTLARDHSFSRSNQWDPVEPTIDQVEPPFDGDVTPTTSREEGADETTLTEETLNLDGTSNNFASFVTDNVPPPPNMADVVPTNTPLDIEEFMALLERHVERMAVASTPENANTANQMLISLTGSVFSQASLLLTRTASGWSLKTMGIHDENLGRIKRHAQSLVERFAARGLGDLEFDLIEPIVHQSGVH